MLSQHVPTLQLPIVSLQYLPELHSVSIIDSIGNVILYGLDDEMIEIVGEIEGGVTLAQWSPDGDILLLLTKANQTVLAMNRDFEILFEESLNKQPTGHAAPLKLSTDSEIAPPQLSWRADGQLFSINSTDVDGKRYIRVWSRDGELISKSETKIEGLGNLLSYRPSGEIIASHQYLESRNETRIIFLEKNGLQHYDFLFSQEKSIIHHVQWNSDSDLLCVHSSSPSKEGSIVQLWHRNNYFWYLKYEIDFTNDSFPEMIWWDPEMSPFRLHISTKSSNYHIYDFKWDHITTPGETEHNSVMIGVIAGREIKLTPLRFSVIPPPLSVDKILLEDSVSSLSFSENRLFALSNKANVFVYEFDITSKPPKFGLPAKQIGSFSLENYTNGLGFCPRHLKAISNNLVMAVVSNFEDPQDGEYLQIYKEQEGKWELINSTFYSNRILDLSVAVHSPRVFVSTHTGEIFFQELNGSAHKYNISFPQPCITLKTCTFGEEEALIGLTERGVLYFNSSIVSSECTSLFVHDSFFLFTTFSNNMRILSRRKSLDDAISIGTSIPSNSTYDESCRSIERGTVIVGAIPKGTLVVLQMPRGNLEGVAPRALVLSTIYYQVNKEDYKSAFLNVKKHRIDHDFLYDINPKRFELNIEKFIRAVEKPDDINLFLTSISNEVVTISKYKEYSNEFQHENLDLSGMHRKPTDPLYFPPIDPTKVNRITKLFRETLRKINSNKYVTSILTTYAKSRPALMEEALHEILFIRDGEAKGENPDGSSLDALKYLTFLVNVDDLYDIALGMYDFKLAVMVAQQSTKDPKEYLPYLAELQKQEKNLQRYNIDLSLGRYSKALSHLAVMEENEIYFEKAIKLIEEERLYKDALKLFKNEKNLITLTKIYAKYLEDNMDYEQAGYAYLKSENYESALNCFKESGNYRLAMTLSKKLNYLENQVSSLAKTLADACLQKGDSIGAATLHADYLADVEEAVRILCTSQKWNEALRLSSLHNSDLIQKIIISYAKSEYLLFIEDMNEQKSKFETYIKRLKEIREERRNEEEERLRKINEGFDEDGLGDVDALSDAGSMRSGVSQSSTYSGVSVYSTYSGLNKTRVARSKKKRTKLRKGSPFEEANLVKRLESSVPSMNWIQDTAQLAQVLIFIGEFNKASEVQKLMSELLQLCIDEKKEIEFEFDQPEIEGEKKKHITPQKVLDIIGVKTPEEAFKWKIDIINH